MRIALDAYYTPVKLACRLVGQSPVMGVGETVLEPHAGGGAFVAALVGTAATVSALDVNPDAPGLAMVPEDRRFIGDFLSHKHEYDWVVGNPPYSDAEAHVRHALSIARKGAAFLLRLAFLESAGREDFWRANTPSRVIVLTRRPSFTGGGTDNCAYGWFIWHKQAKGPTTLGFMMGGHG